MKKITVFLAATLLLSACGSAQSVESQAPTPEASITTAPEILREELVVYLKELAEIGSLENDVVQTFASTFSPGYKVNDELLATMKSLVPKAKRFTRQLSNLTVTSGELIDFHASYVRVWQEQSRAMEDLLQALETNTEIEGILETIKSIQNEIPGLKSQFDKILEYSGLQVQN